MKYFIVADVHGFYNEMIAALEAKGFDANNPDHMLISLGDVFDRGKQPIEVMKFLNDLHKKGKAILVRGNHEDLMQHMLLNYPQGHDESNGTINTAKALAADKLGVKFISNGWIRSDWGHIARKAMTQEDYDYYTHNTVDYFETEHYIFVHGWLPVSDEAEWDAECHRYKVIDGWRDADQKTWSDARWVNGCEASLQGAFVEGKTMVCGHIHASMWHEFCDNKKAFTVFTPYIGDQVIACDACTAYSGFVNCVVLED